MILKLFLICAVRSAWNEELLVGSTTAFPELSHILSDTPPSIQERTVQDLVKRVLPADRFKDFVLTVDPSLYGEDLKDRFVLEKHEYAGSTRLSVTGSSGVAVASGFYYYLTQYCHSQITWAGRQLDLPTPLVLPEVIVDIVSNDRFRYYQNVCTTSYSSVWWTWARWEREIDWMALHGVNLPLAFTGQEAIWSRVYLNLGLNRSELDDHFGGPGFLSWSRMGNIHRLGGPLSNNWHSQQVALQHSILKRMRNLGMIPVLPGFAGHVPKGLKRVFPKASISQLGHWSHFYNTTYCCTYLLEPDDPLFVRIGKSFLEQLRFEFGTDHVYNADTFNEMTPRSSDTAYLTAVGSATFAAMTVSDPKAIWMLQGWLFVNEETFWQPPQVKAYLKSVPKGKMIILDLMSDVSPQYTRLDSYYGQPFIWCMLQNFGGTLGLYGAIESINKGPFKARGFKNSSMIGIGLTPEGIEQNEVMYEFMMENSWRRKPVDLEKWFEAYPSNRYGSVNANSTQAWLLLLGSVYNCTTNLKNHGKYIVVRRPNLHLKPNIWYDSAMILKAWSYFVRATDDPIIRANPLFRYDLVDVTRQALQVLGATYYGQLVNAYRQKNRTSFNSVGSKLLSLLRDMDDVLASDSHFLLGVWLSAARLQGLTGDESKLYEYNARNQITLWGPNGQILDYACKQWSGLMKSYYYDRWKLFLKALNASIISKTAFNQHLYDRQVFQRVERPWTFNETTYPNTTKGDSIIIAKTLWEKYNRETASKSSRRGSRLMYEQSWTWLYRSVKHYSTNLVNQMSKIVNGIWYVML